MGGNVFPLTCDLGIKPLPAVEFTQWCDQQTTSGAWNYYEWKFFLHEKS